MSFIENSVHPDHYPVGEELLDRRAVLEVIEIEKHLWSVMVKDGGILEVEILNPNTKRQRSTCECKIYQEEKSCQHIAAALLHLRKIEDHKRAKEKKEVATAKSTFNIRTVLAKVQTDQLLAFVKSYAKADKNFSVMLKASFAKAVDVHDTTAKYSGILSTLIKPVGTSANQSTAAELRLALRVTEEFHDQLEDSISVSAYQEAICIIAASLSKLHYLYAKYSHNKVKVAKWIKKYHDRISVLYQENLAPSLLSQIDEVVLDLAQKSYYNHLESVVSLYQVALRHDRTDLLAALHAIYTDTTLRSSREEDRPVLGAIYILAADYHKLALTDDSLIRSIEYLARTNSNSQAIGYMEQIVTQNLRNRKIERALLSAYLEEGMTDKYQSLAIDLYVKYGDIRYYRQLKATASAEAWPRIRSKILDSLITEKADATLLSSYYVNEEMHTELLAVLRMSLDLRLIMKHDYYLNKVDHLMTITLYKEAIKAYLDSHAGSAATAFISEVFVHLKQIGAYKLEKHLKDYINTNFSHRGGYFSFSQ